MIKNLVVLLAIVVVANGFVLVGGWYEREVDEHIMELANWSTTQLSEYTNGKDHTIMTVKNAASKIVSGINYRFTLDVVVHTVDNKYEYKSCDIEIHEYAWTNTRYFANDPKCKDLSF